MRPLVLASASFAAALSISTITGLAGANGRFPFANQLVVDPSDPKHVVVRTTFGLVQTFDLDAAQGRATWSWICEQSVGYGGVFDPAIGVTASGRILAGLFGGLTTSADRGCSFAVATLEKDYVIDLVVEPGDPRRAVAMTSTGLGGEGFRVVLVETNDAGATWTPLGTPLPTDFNSETLEVAPSRPSRIYLSGTTGTLGRTGVLQRSDDRGVTWERFTIDLRGGRAPFLSAVDPKDPDLVWLRIDGTPNDPAEPGDRLLRSRDGGATFEEVFTTAGDLFGFALSPDGRKVAIGGPRDGVLVADAADAKFEARAEVGARCLAWTDAGLFACASEYPDGFTVGLSTDEGRSFRGIYQLAELSPLSCAPSTTTGAQCPRQWPATQITIGQELDAGPRPSEAGVDSGPPPPPGETPASRGCGCDVTGSSWSVAGTVAALAALLALLGRRAFVR
jgi:hypothetical protein